MPFKREPQVFSARVGSLSFGAGANEITLGGENVLPLYSFDAPIINRPKIGVAINDSGFAQGIPGLGEFYSGAGTVAEIAKRAASMPGADFLVISLIGAHPNNGDKSPEECAALISEIESAVDIPIAVEGCGNAEKDAKVFEKISEELYGKNILVLSACEENYKSVAAAGLAYSQNIAAESSVDVNLAKQLNVLISQIGLKPAKTVMNVGSAAAGYGFEYVSSTMERTRIAALEQNDSMLQLPIITPVYSQAWAVKESLASEEDYPDWGPAEERGISMEIATAAACLASGSNAVILLHPKSVATVSALIRGL